MARKRILIVDDDLVKFRDTIKSSFEASQIEADVVEDYDGAIERTKKERFDLIIIDVGLVGAFNGIDLLRAIRKSDKQTKIYILTAYGEEYRKDALAGGADKYLLKPLDPVNHILKPLGLLN